LEFRRVLFRSVEAIEVLSTRAPSIAPMRIVRQSAKKGIRARCLRGGRTTRSFGAAGAWETWGRRIAWAGRAISYAPFGDESFQRRAAARVWIGGFRRSPHRPPAPPRG